MDNKNIKRLFSLLSNVSNGMSLALRILTLAPASFLFKAISESLLLYKIIAQGFNIFGNASWATSATFGSQAPRKKNAWYGFASYNIQQIVAAFINSASAILMIASFFNPLFLPIASVGAAAGSILWAISEYHHKNNQNPEDTIEDVFKQQFYWKYVYAMAIATVIFAVNTTFIFIFPPATLIANVITSMPLGCFMALGLFNLVKSWVAHPPSSKPRETNASTSSVSESQELEPPRCFPSPLRALISRNLEPNQVNSFSPPQP